MQHIKPLFGVQACYYFIQISLAIFTGVTVTKNTRHYYISSPLSCVLQAIKNPKVVFKQSKYMNYKESYVVPGKKDEMTIILGGP